MQIIRVGSLGAGVQSSTMILLCNDGKIAPPNFWIFADTQAEPEEVYDWLNYLKSICQQPIITTTKGNIVEDTLGVGKFASAPFYIKKSDEFYAKELNLWTIEREKLKLIHGKNWSIVHKNKPKQIVMGRRQCTNEYKISQIQKEVRNQLGYKKYQRMTHQVEMMIGISTDEIQRVKESRIAWIKNVYPLIEINMSRKECLTYFDSKGLNRPPRSACWFCPFKRDSEWIYLRNNQPKEFLKAIAFDKAIRTLPKFKHQNYLHSSCLPLDQIIFNISKKDKMAGIINECEGMCGV